MRRTVAVASLLFWCLCPRAIAQERLFTGPVDRLPPLERAALRQGQVVVTGNDGSYTARVLLGANASQVWQVLTDYPNLPKFIPNMVESRVLQQEGDRKIVEQIDRRQVVLISVVSRLRLQIREIPQQQVQFQLIAGDLESMEGSWQIEPVSPIPLRPPSQTLITHTVRVQPKAGIPRDTFQEIFRDSLVGTLHSIGREVQRRSRL
ncbi:MAG: cyclase/dehydrase [Oscillatoriales cyanobacterium SM2_2_1]|nr:cyclase/dehydrase [Oscillatoriales cyanobacterium SM2_2_1]